MTIEKIYQSLTTKELGVYKDTTVDSTDGKIKHVLIVDGQEKEVSDSTFKRWWKLVEETTNEDLQESLDSLNEIKDNVLKEQPTIEDLKELNESGVELTEEELQMFKEQSQEQPQQEKVEQPKVKQPKVRKGEITGVGSYLMTLVEQNGGIFHIYTEGREGVIKFGGKPVMFFGFVKGGIRLYMKDALDEMLGCPYPVEEKHSYPKQYPFRVVIPELNEQSKKLLNDILSLHI
jgi:hypothetical protein